jgi:hypothetical protein
VEPNFKLTFKRDFIGLRPWRRHSTILVVAGFIYTLIGLQYIFGPENPVRDASLVVVLQLAPIEVWGTVFILAGVGSIVSSRWPPLSEIWGYMVLTGLSAAWAATYASAMLIYGAVNSVTGTMVFSLLAFMWWAISGLLNPDRSAVASRG